MLYKDQVYGNFEITEPVILELIKSPAIQRLKYIDQGGMRSVWFKTNKNFRQIEISRFTHSIGVYILLKKYNASIEEQISGLIHDVSHSVFSHCIDFVKNFKFEKHDSFQDKIFVNFIKKTNIPKILKKYNYDIEYILNDNNFPLKEKKLPDLCADRIDYSLRDSLVFNVLKKQEIKYFLNNLKVYKINWVFKNFESAKNFAEFFNNINKNYYGDFASAKMFKTISDWISYALIKKYIDFKDLYTTDKKVIRKINKFNKKDRQLDFYWQALKNKQIITNNPKDYDEIIICKSRAIDPIFLDNSKIKRLSEIYPKWKQIIKQESQPKQYFLKFNKFD